jgi:hypothetical protein
MEDEMDTGYELTKAQEQIKKAFNLSRSTVYKVAPSHYPNEWTGRKCFWTGKFEHIPGTDHSFPVMVFYKHDSSEYAAISPTIIVKA